MNVMTVIMNYKLPSKKVNIIYGITRFFKSVCNSVLRYCLFFYNHVVSSQGLTLKAIQFTHISLDTNHNCRKTGGSEILEELLREGRERQSQIFRVNTYPSDLGIHKTIKLRLLLHLVVSCVLNMRIISG